MQPSVSAQAPPEGPEWYKNILTRLGKQPEWPADKEQVSQTPPYHFNQQSQLTLIYYGRRSWSRTRTWTRTRARRCARS